MKFFDRLRAWWTFKQNSFLPHAPAGPTLEEPVPPVLIGHGETPAGDSQVLINLTGEVPLFFSRFERVAEVSGPGDE